MILLVALNLAYDCNNYNNRGQLPRLAQYSDGRRCPKCFSCWQYFFLSTVFLNCQHVHCLFWRNNILSTLFTWKCSLNPTRVLNYFWLESFWFGYVCKTPKDNKLWPKFHSQWFWQNKTSENIGWCFQNFHHLFSRKIVTFPSLKL